MRVVAGIYRSRLLKAEVSDSTRPTMDNVKEALFNVIGPRIYDATFLDLFSGTGGIGIEAISRGAKYCYFNDFNKKAYEATKSNIESLNIEKSVYTITLTDYMDCLEHIDKKLDIVFLDPPYIDKVYLNVIEYLKRSGKLNDHSLIIIEAENSYKEEELSSYNIKVKVYGKKKLIFIQL